MFHLHVSIDAGHGHLLIADRAPFSFLFVGFLHLLLSRLCRTVLQVLRLSDSPVLAMLAVEAPPHMCNSWLLLATLRTLLDLRREW